MIHLESREQFDQLINGKCIAMFSATWCRDCRFIEPHLPDIASAHPDYAFVIVDRDRFLDLCQEYGIMGIPSFIVFKNGEIIGTFISKLRKTKEEILDFFDRVINQ
ncbi:MAG TPA: thioredoxin family protein [Haloplasmataceae bacterium]